jgi:hypothetical protein
MVVVYISISFLHIHGVLLDLFVDSDAFFWSRVLSIELNFLDLFVNFFLPLVSNALVFSLR